MWENLNLTPLPDPRTHPTDLDAGVGVGGGGLPTEIEDNCHFVMYIFDQQMLQNFNLTHPRHHTPRTHPTDLDAGLRVLSQLFHRS